MPKSKPQPFQLKPKHLVYAVLGISVSAIIALVIGVVGTFKPRDEERRQEETEQKQERNTNRVEVWKPSGSNTQETIVLNPDAVNQPKQPAQQREPVAEEGRNPFAAQKSERSGTAEEQVRRARPRPADAAEGERPRAARIEAAKPLEPKPAAAAAQTAPAPTAQPPRAEPKPEPRSEPKPQAESKPAPAPQPKPQAPAQPRQQQKEVIDNLF